MLPQEFVDFHRPALERDEVRHHLILAGLGRLAAGVSSATHLWTLGDAGACAIQSPGLPIMLGGLDAAQCGALAEQTIDHTFSGVVGPEQTAPWFIERAATLGVKFSAAMPQQIHVLRESPIHPVAPGFARAVAVSDAALFADWTIAFLQEAIPDERIPPREVIENAAGQGRYQFWIVDGVPVSMAGIFRRSRNAASITGVYTPPALRGCGFAGSVTAAIVEAIFAEGRAAACLYTDCRNPASNRCYAKIGFRPVCQSWHYVRA